MERFEFNDLPQPDLLEISKSGTLGAALTTDNSQVLLPVALIDRKSAQETFLANEVQRAQKELHTLQVNADAGWQEATRSSIELTFAQNQPKLQAFSFDLRLNEIKAADERFKSAFNDYLEFRKQEKRQYSAVDFDKPFWSWGVCGLLVLLFFIESGMNAFLFKDAEGYATAYALSLSQSFLNIGGCFLVGRFFVGPALVVPQVGRKIYYLTILAIHLIFTFWLNLALGLWRAIVLQNPEEVEDKPEIANAALQPWAYLEHLSTDSALIVGVGLVLATLAYLKGRFSDDPYPHYGKKARVALKARQETERLVAKLNDEKIQLETEFTNSKMTVETRNGTGIERWSTAINEMEKIEVDYTALVEEANADWERCIEAYEAGYGSSLPEKLKKPLFDERKQDAKMVFRDASEYFLTDNDRREKKASEEQRFSEDKVAIENNIRETIDSYIEKVAPVESSYPSQINFP